MFAFSGQCDPAVHKTRISHFTYWSVSICPVGNCQQVQGWVLRGLLRLHFACLWIWWLMYWLLDEWFLNVDLPKKRGQDSRVSRFFKQYWLLSKWFHNVDPPQEGQAFHWNRFFTQCSCQGLWIQRVRSLAPCLNPCQVFLSADKMWWSALGN